MMTSMSMSKRISAIVLSILCMISLLPCTALAATCEHCGNEIVEEAVPMAEPTPDMRTYASKKGYPITVDGKAINFRDKGVIKVDDMRYYYISSYSAPLEDTAEWYLCDDGFYRNADGYIIVIANCYDEYEDVIIPTPFGEGIVVGATDDANSVCIYTNY